ncbi:PepSY domain-containing protein [Pseudonocardia sp. DSM 110487]|uniref:PepSY-associated TM helix domain-containing protein n=1 Tax=Pseudonocardia sp. DSM 110487 TaxID=2865833 RepID=UPI001C69C2A1|nr:PepSY domain-containing protein [Pseudonocardia sp. DSM 110487]QYN34299.1 PepSY domain-containing protein [Pseudonocardia sp. DSM 110487]
MSPRHEIGSGAREAHAGRPSGWSITGRAARKWPLAGSAAQLRPLARRVHFMAGLLVAPFLLVLCMTGLVYVCSPQIHEDLYGGQLFVPEVGDNPRPVTEQVVAALAAHPEAELRSVVPPPGPDRTTRVNLAVPSLTEPGEARTVFVDPYTNYISGELTTVDGRMPANVWLRDLHTDLHLGAVGRLYSEVAASWLPVIVLGGLVVWIAKQGRRRRGIRELLTPLPRGKGEQARMRAVHGPLGIWLTAGLLVMSVTGLTMSRFAGWGLPAVRAPELAMAPVVVPGDVAPAGVDRVLQVARAEGLRGEVQVAAPTAPDQPFTVAEISAGLPIRKGSIAVDPYTAQVTERIGWDDYPFLAQLREMGQQAHTGTLFGVANQIVLGLLVIATIVLILIGYRMWWKRSPYGERLASAPPPALRQLTATVGVPVVLVTVVLGWLMPAFGLSLAAFVVLDLVINAVRQRQERLRRAVTAGALLVAVAAFGVAVVINTPSPATRVDAVNALPDRRVPEPAPLYPPPPVDQAVPDQPVPGEAVGEDVVAAPPRSIQGGRAGAQAGPAPAPPARDIDAPADRPGDTEPVRGETGSSDTRRDGGSGDSRDSERPHPSEAPDEPGNPSDDVPEPAPPPAKESPDDSPGIVGGLVGNVVDTVRSVTGGLLGG